MKATPANLVAHELVGRPARVTAATQPGLVGRRGIIVDETRNMVHLRTVDRIIAIPKRGITLAIELETGSVVLEGARLIGRPEERVRRLR